MKNGTSSPACIEANAVLSAMVQKLSPQWKKEGVFSALEKERHEHFSGRNDLRCKFELLHFAISCHYNIHVDTQNSRKLTEVCSIAKIIDGKRHAINGQWKKSIDDTIHKVENMEDLLDLLHSIYKEEPDHLKWVNHELFNIETHIHIPNFPC